MNDLIRNLVFASKTAEISDNRDVASSLLEASENLHMIKTAQYVGIQGTWIRNGRCFTNCIRMKKSSNPDLKDQQIWSECHKEWMGGIHYDSNEKFDKYASSNDPLINEIHSKVNSGSDYGTAAWNSILEQNFSIAHELYRNAKLLTNCITKISNIENKELKEDIIKISKELDMLAEQEFSFVISEIFNEG